MVWIFQSNSGKFCLFLKQRKVGHIYEKEQENRSKLKQRQLIGQFKRLENCEKCVNKTQHKSQCEMMTKQKQKHTPESDLLHGRCWVPEVNSHVTTDCLWKMGEIVGPEIIYKTGAVSNTWLRTSFFPTDFLLPNSIQSSWLSWIEYMYWLRSHHWDGNLMGFYSLPIKCYHNHITKNRKQAEY